MLGSAGFGTLGFGRSRVRRGNVVLVSDAAAMTATGSRGHIQMDGIYARLLHHRRLRAEPGGVNAAGIPATFMKRRVQNVFPICIGP